MREVLYSKYNSRRRPIFQLSTTIIRDGDKQYAVKKAIQPRAEAHLRKLVENREKLLTLYKDIDVVECIEETDGIAFPFIEGRHLLDDIDLVNGSLDTVMADLRNGLERISSYKEDMVCQFEMTESFAEVFKGCTPNQSEEAIKLANIDSLFANFVELEDGKLCCLDYEWVLDFPIPTRYITFRNIYYFYHDNENYLKNMIEKDVFYYEFGYTDEDVALFTKMEDEFQQYVHGVNWEYMYLERYKKKTTIWAEVEGDMQTAKLHPMMVEQREDLKKEVQHWIGVAETQQAHLEKMRKAIKNPLYGIKWAGEKVVRKIKGR